MSITVSKTQKTHRLSIGLPDTCQEAHREPVCFLASRHSEIVCLAPVPGVEQILTGLKNLAPQIGKIKLPGGGIVALAAIAQMTDSLAQSNIGRHTQLRTKRHDKDNQQVVKVKDSIDCVERVMTDPETLLFLAKDIVSAIIDPGSGQIDPKIHLDPIADCIRAHALRQNTPRVLVSKRFYHRPARGHGRGRPKF